MPFATGMPTQFVSARVFVSRGLPSTSRGRAQLWRRLRPSVVVLGFAATCFAPRFAFAQASSCIGSHTINANGFLGTLNIPTVGNDGSFSATLTFNGGSPEQVSGTCTNGAITFDRSAGSQVYTGNYSNQGMSGTFAFQGQAYYWTVPACNGKYRVSANGHPAWLAIPGVAVDGSFSATLAFDGAPAEQVSGTCSAGAITFNRISAGQIYTGTYSSAGLSGSFTSQGGPYSWSAPYPACSDTSGITYSITANGHWGTLTIPPVAANGSFAATLTFNGGSPEQVSGTCSGGAITFTRTVGPQVYAGNYSNQGISGTFAYLGVTYYWNAMPPSCNGNYSLTANGYTGTLVIPNVATDGSFAATLMFDGQSPEPVAGSCLSGAITFTRTSASQVYTGSYPTMSGQFTSQGLTYSWSATLLSAPQTGPDSRVTILSAGDMTSRRIALIRNAFQTSSLPGTQSSVTTNIANPFPAFTNITRVDQYTASMSNGQTNTSNLYLAGPFNINRLVILNPGHAETCVWPLINQNYQIQPLLQALLNAGFSVFAMNMPGCGTVSIHDALFQSYGDAAMHYFVEPIVQALNYMDVNFAFQSYDIVGLSGGGWTATIAPALDTRIQISIPVAGSMPGIHFVPGASNNTQYGDAEQGASDYLSIAGYADQYVMAAAGANRQHVQILNLADDCCFGALQWSESQFSFQAYYGVDWPTYLSEYQNAIGRSQSLRAA